VTKSKYDPFDLGDEWNCVKLITLTFVLVITSFITISYHLGFFPDLYSVYGCIGDGCPRFTYDYDIIPLIGCFLLSLIYCEYLVWFTPDDNDDWDYGSLLIVKSLFMGVGFILSLFTLGLSTSVIFLSKKIIPELYNIHLRVDYHLLYGYSLDFIGLCFLFGVLLFVNMQRFKTKKEAEL
jgi:hypothetical protein